MISVRYFIFRTQIFRLTYVLLHLLLSENVYLVRKFEFFLIEIKQFSFQLVRGED